jgi:hypothetical protein
MQQQANGDASGNQQMSMGYNGGNFNKYFNGGLPKYYHGKNHPTEAELKNLLAYDSAFGGAGEDAMYQIEDTPESIENDMALWQEPSAKSLAIDNANSVWDYVGKDYDEASNTWKDPVIETPEPKFPDSPPQADTPNQDFLQEMIKNAERNRRLGNIEDLAQNVYVEPRVYNPEEQTYRDYLGEVESMARKGVDYDTYYQDQEAMKGSEAARQAALRYSGGDPAVAMAMLERGQAIGDQALRKSAIDRGNFQAGQKQNLMNMLDKIGASKYKIGADRAQVDTKYNQDYVAALSGRDATLMDVEKNYLDYINTLGEEYYKYGDRQMQKDTLEKVYGRTFNNKKKYGGKFKKYFK